MSTCKFDGGTEMTIYRKAKDAKFAIEFALMMLACGRDEEAVKRIVDAVNFLAEIIEGEEKEAAI
jgi:hypothetical protein